MKRVSGKVEAFELTTDELLKRMSKEQAIILIQGALHRLEEPLNDPEVPAAKIRLEKVLEAVLIGPLLLINSDCGQLKSVVESEGTSTSTRLIGR